MLAGIARTWRRLGRRRAHLRSWRRRARCCAGRHRLPAERQRRRASPWLRGERMRCGSVWMDAAARSPKRCDGGCGVTSTRVKKVVVGAREERRTGAQSCAAEEHSRRASWPAARLCLDVSLRAQAQIPPTSTCADDSAARSIQAAARSAAEELLAVPGCLSNTLLNIMAPSHRRLEVREATSGRCFAQRCGCASTSPRRGAPCRAIIQHAPQRSAELACVLARQRALPALCTRRQRPHDRV